MKKLILATCLIFLGVAILYTTLTFKTVRTLRDYQILLSEDSIHLYDGTRYVGAVHLANTAIDSLIYKDNQ